MYLLGFGVIGVIALLRAFAASSLISVEPEAGVINNVTTPSDASASGGKSIRFGAQVVVPYAVQVRNIGPLANELNVASNGSWGWNSPISSTGTDQYKITIRPTSTQTQNNYFWSSSFVWSGNPGSGGYIGLQTRVFPLGARGSIFSMWNTTVAEAVSGGIAKPFDGEGVGMQTAIPVNWVANRDYQVSIQRDSSRSTTTYNWWVGSVRDLTTGTVSNIGYIRTPTTWGYMIPNNTFLERYGASNTCSNFEPSSGIFRDLLARSGSSYLSPKSVVVELREYSDCGNVVSANSTGSGYNVMINKGTPR